MKLKYLCEAPIAGGKVQIAMSLIISFLERNLGIKLVKIPGIEGFINSKYSGYGYRYAINGTKKMIRFNWGSKPDVDESNEIHSIDIFNGKRDPSFTLTTKDISFAKSLPALVSILASPALSKVVVFPVNPREAVTESVKLTEAHKFDFTAEQALTDFISKLQSGVTMTRTEFIDTYHISHVGIFDTIINDFKNEFQISGRRVGLGGNVHVNELKDKILSTAGVIEVTKGGTNEIYLQTESEKDASDIQEHVSYVDTLNHLEGLVTGIIKGAFNALFVVGKGGTGKTQTVERVLEEHGLSDGEGYFKNVGAASAIGIYTLLYQHKNDIIVFDDSDSALADQDSRNLLKAATDTKKIRKLVWNKKSSFIFDPDQEDPEEYEDDSSMAPKFFNFSGRIIFISNLSLKKLDPDGALRTRAFIINVDPTDDEMFDFMDKILFKIKLEEGLTLSDDERREVFDVVKKSKRKGDVSLRKLVRALNLAASGASNWKELVTLYA